METINLDFLDVLELAKVEHVLKEKKCHIYLEGKEWKKDVKFMGNVTNEYVRKCGEIL